MILIIEIAAGVFLGMSLRSFLSGSHNVVSTAMMPGI
jgi:hypothetical protein